MLTVMKGMLAAFQKKGRNRSSDALEVIPASPALIALKPDLGAPQSRLPSPADRSGPKSEETLAGPDPALIDAAKTSPTRHDVAVLSLADSGEILSARGSCSSVFGWDCSALSGKNIQILLKGGLDNEVGKFLERRRSLKNVTETVVLRVTVLRQDGTEFPASVTTPTWSLGTRLTKTSDTSHLGWTLAIRGLASNAEAAAPIPPSIAPIEGQSAGTVQLNESRSQGQEMRPDPATGKPTLEGAIPEVRPSDGQPFQRHPGSKDWFDSEEAPSDKSMDRTASTPAAQAVTPDQTATTIRPLTAEMRCSLATQQRVVAESNRSADELLLRLNEKTAELERLQAELERQKAERAQAESEWRRELNTVATALGAKMEAAGTNAQERDKRSENELAAIRQERDELKRQLEAQQLIAREAGQRLQETENPLRHAAQEQDSTTTEAGKRSEEKSRQECELRAQLDAAKEASGYAEAALKEETLRRKRFEELSRNLRHEQTGVTRRYEDEMARLREERDQLNSKLTAEQEISADSRKQAEDLERRLTLNAAELERTKLALDQYRAEMVQAEHEWRKRCEEADSRSQDNAKTANRPEGVACLEGELANLRRERDEIKSQLEAEQKSAAESKRRSKEIESQWRRTVGDLERLQAEADQQFAEQQRRDAELRAKLDAATEAAGSAKAALRAEVGRREEFERLTTSLRLEQFEKDRRSGEDLTSLRKERDELRRRLATEERVASDCRRRVEELEAGHSQCTVESERVRTDLERQLAEQECEAAEWREQIEAAISEKTIADAALAEANELKKRIEEDSAVLRKGHDELNSRLAAEQLAATESKRRVEDLENRLNQSVTELEQARAESSEHGEERRKIETQWRHELNAANSGRQKVETALAEAECRERSLEEEVAHLRQERDALGESLSGEHRCATESSQRAETSERRLGQAAAELARVKADLQQQCLESQRLESEWKQELSAARIQKEKMEAAWTGAVERNKHLEEQLTAIRQDGEELNDKLAGVHQAAAESARRAETAERRLSQSTAELTRVKAELEKLIAEKESVESEWRDQLAASKALTKKLETAWTGAVERYKRVEEEIAVLRQEIDELGGKLTAEQMAVSEFRRRAEASERCTRLHELELQRLKAPLETKEAPQGRAKVEFQSQRHSMRDPAKLIPSTSGSKPPARPNGAPGDSYSSPTTLIERYNLQP